MSVADAGGGVGASAHVAPQVTGSPVSVLTPLFDGPRQLGQSEARRALPAATVRIEVQLSNARIENPPFRMDTTDTTGVLRVAAENQSGAGDGRP